MPEQLREFLKLHDELKERFPGRVESKREVAENVGDPKAEDPEETWRVLWGKPHYTRVHVKIGEGWKDQIAPWMPCA